MKHNFWMEKIEKWKSLVRYKTSRFSPNCQLIFTYSKMIIKTISQDLLGIVDTN